MDRGKNECPLLKFVRLTLFKFRSTNLKNTNSNSKLSDSLCLLNYEMWNSIFSLWLWKYVFLFWCLSVCLYICLSIFLYNCLFICLYVFLSFCRSVFLSFYLSVFVSYSFTVFLSFCLSAFLSFCLSVFLPFCLSVYLPFCLSVFLEFRLLVNVSLCRYLSMFVCIFFSCSDYFLLGDCIPLEKSLWSIGSEFEDYFEHNGPSQHCLRLSKAKTERRKY
jgi:hypothetical protein